METIKVNVGDIKPYERNAKKHDERQIKNVMESIKQFGLVQPLVIDKNGVLIIGHCRLIAAKRLKMREVDCIRAEDLTQEQVDKLRLLDNKLNESEWDYDLLLEDIPTLDFDGFDIDWNLPEIESPAEEIIEDEPPEIPEEAKAVLGDIYEIGRDHRLICGDSTDPATIERLMGGVKADMVFTDPPYGVAYTGGMKIENGKIESNGKKQIKNDALDYEDLYQFLYKAFLNIQKFSREKAPLYVFYTHSRSREFLNAFADAGLKQRSIIIWHKTSGGFGDFMAQYMNAYEPCIYGSNGNTVDWYGASNEKTVWDMDKEKKCDLHPTMKPVELVARAIRNSSKKEDHVLDLFGGSGSTLMACEQLHRKSYSCELDPKYVDVIVQRYINLKGSNEDVFLIRDGQRIPYKDVK